MHLIPITTEAFAMYSEMATEDLDIYAAYTFWLKLLHERKCAKIEHEASLEKTFHCGVKFSEVVLGNRGGFETYTIAGRRVDRAMAEGLFVALGEALAYSK